MKLVTFSSLATLAFAAQTAGGDAPPSAATRARQVIAKMMDGDVLGVVSKKRHAPTSAGDPGIVEVTFRHHRQRYTVLYAPPAGADLRPQLSFWVRPDDANEDGACEIFSDERADGTVDGGVGPGRGERLFSCYQAATSVLPTVTGEENRAYWQARYEAALRAACEFMDARKQG